jgi:hypothetical protein
MGHEDIRFGMVGVKKGILTPEQVIKALQIQVEENLSTGGHRRIGEILLDKNEIRKKDIQEIMQALRQMGLA